MLAPDLPGHGQSSQPLKRASLKQYVNFIEDLLAAETEPLILVGHSMAGMVISQVADNIPARVRGLIYLSAFLPRDGDSVFSLMETHEVAHGPSHIRRVMKFSEDKRQVNLDPDLASTLFYPDCPRGTASWASRQLGAEASLALSGKVSISRGGFAGVAKAYVHCLRDQVLPLAQQGWMLERQPCPLVHNLDSGHSPFLSQPGALAHTLDSIAGQWQFLGNL